MKKKTVVTTEKLEIWVIQPSGVPPDIAPSPATDRHESMSTSGVLPPVPQKHPDKNVKSTLSD
jgi:hypothetical protein